MRTLTLDIVSPKGPVLHAEELDAVTVRRREQGAGVGSRVTILRGHAPLLMQVQPCTLVAEKGSSRRQVEIGRGVLEVWGERVTIVLT